MQLCIGSPKESSAARRTCFFALFATHKNQRRPPFTRNQRFLEVGCQQLETLCICFLSKTFPTWSCCVLRRTCNSGCDLSVDIPNLAWKLLGPLSFNWSTRSPYWICWGRLYIEGDSGDSSLEIPHPLLVLFLRPQRVGQGRNSRARLFLDVRWFEKLH